MRPKPMRPGDLVVRGPLRQGIDHMRARRIHHCCPRGSLPFQALVALYTAVNVVDSFAVFPDQFHAVDATITRIEEGQIVDVTIGKRYPYRPVGSLAC